ncbi:PE-PGRS family protein [Streptomyces sp. ISID311]|uniref:PE-PGRS family protein n=1 Tax=Streptomyces sp. ISID311 TaxID=2601673 RepID=UPI0011BD31A8|nr:PE-PGRS family protein [Streptomyces sp. ISID311]TXC94542.1 PE-PGRS family protein [Streptomyces sp. ISID311]
MTDFRREPEWDQQADRHTWLTDPVLTVRQLSRFGYTARKTATRIDNALVFVKSKGGYDTYLPPRRPSRGEIAAGRYTAVYEVDTGIHQLSLELALPSDNDAFEFAASAAVTWQVADPAAFVASGERDVPSLLTRRLRQLVRPVTRRHPVENSPTAERAVQNALHTGDPLGAAAVGLRVTCDVHLRLDDAAISHHQELRALRYADEQLTPAHALRMREDRLEADRSLEQGRHQHALVMQQQNLVHEHALLQGAQQIELHEIEKKKIAFYQYHLQQGGVAAWAFHLAQHPEDSRLVMEHLRQDQLILIKSQLEVATEIIKGDVAEEYEMEEPKRLALQTLNAILTQQLPGAIDGPAQVPPPVPGPDVPAPPAQPPHVPAGPTQENPAYQKTATYAPPGYGTAPYGGLPAKASPPQPTTTSAADTLALHEHAAAPSAGPEDTPPAPH